jgi:hypothetical protein
MKTNSGRAGEREGESSMSKRDKVRDYISEHLGCAVTEISKGTGLYREYRDTVVRQLNFLVTKGAEMSFDRPGLRLKVDYYSALIKNDALIEKSFGFYEDGTRCYNLANADDLAIPVGGNRRSGMLEMTGEHYFSPQAARKIVRLLQKWPERFPNVRLDDFDCYVEWGDPIPGLIQDDDESIVLARGKQFGYRDEGIFQFLALVRANNNRVPGAVIIEHMRTTIKDFQPGSRK